MLFLWIVAVVVSVFPVPSHFSCFEMVVYSTQSSLYIITTYLKGNREPVSRAGKSWYNIRL